MARTRVALPLALALTTVITSAQSSTVTFNLELYRNDELVSRGRGQVAVDATGKAIGDGAVGLTSKDSAVSVMVTPTRRDADAIRLALDIDSDGQVKRSQVVLRDEPAVVTWTLTNRTETYEFRLTWIR